MSSNPYTFEILQSLHNNALVFLTYSRAPSPFGKLFVFEGFLVHPITYGSVHPMEGGEGQGGREPVKPYLLECKYYQPCPHVPNKFVFKSQSNDFSKYPRIFY